MTTAHVLFLALTGFAALLCLWTAVTTAVRSEQHSAAHRGWALLTAILLPPTTLATALATTFDARWLIALGTALPVLAISATWCNVTTVRGQGFWVKTLHLPVFFLNALLAGIYGVRMVQDQLGVDLGSWGTAVTGCHAMLQTIVGEVDADVDPVWFHLPFMLPLCASYRWPQVFTLLCTSVISSAMLGLLVALMPFAFTRATSFRAEPRAAPVQVRAGLTVGAQLPWAQAIHSQSALEAWRRDLSDLRVRSVSFDVRPGLVADPQMLEQTRREIAEARRRGLEIVAIARPERGRLPGELRDLTLSMAKLHWLVAEKLEPDVLVVFHGPFGRLSHLTVKLGTIDEWMAAIERSASEVRQANPRVRVAVSIESRAPHARELFRRLRGRQSPVDAVGLSVFSPRGTLSEVQARLAMLSSWLETHPGPRPVRIGTGANPHMTGGELGQWNFLRTILAFASSHDIQAVSITALADRETTLGLVTRNGRRRVAFHRLRALLPDPAAPPK